MCLASSTATGSNPALPSRASDPPSNNQWNDFAAQQIQQSRPPRRANATHSLAGPPPAPSTTESIRSLDPLPDHASSSTSTSSSSSPWAKFAARKAQHHEEPVLLPPARVGSSSGHASSRSPLSSGGATLKPSTAAATRYAAQFAEPPNCFCDKPAHRREASVGTVYECHYAGASHGSGSGSDRARHSVCCILHIHARTWLGFGRALHDGHGIDSQHDDLRQCAAFNLTFRTIFRIENAFPVRLHPILHCFCNYRVRPMQSAQRFDGRMMLLCPLMASERLRITACQWFMWAEDAKALPLPTADDDDNSATLPLPPACRSSNSTTTRYSEAAETAEEEELIMRSSSSCGTGIGTGSVTSTSQHSEHSRSMAPPSVNGLITAPASPTTPDAKSECSVAAPEPLSGDASIYSMHHHQQPNYPLLQHAKLTPPAPSADPSNTDKLICLLNDTKVPEWLDAGSASASSDGGDPSPTHSTTTMSTKIHMPVPGAVYARLLINRKKTEHDSEMVALLNQQAQTLQRELQRMEEENTGVRRIYAAKQDAFIRLERQHVAQLDEIAALENELGKLAQEERYLDRSWNKACDLASVEIADVEGATSAKALLDDRIKDLLGRMEILKTQIAAKEELDEKTSLRDFKCRVCFQENIQVALVPCFHCSYCIPCSEKLTECAICRTAKFSVQPVYLD